MPRDWVADRTTDSSDPFLLRREVLEAMESDIGSGAGLDSQTFSQSGRAIIDLSGPWRFKQDSLIVQIDLESRAGPLGGPFTVQYLLDGMVFATMILEAGITSTDPLALTHTAPSGAVLQVRSTSVGTSAEAESPVTTVWYLPA